MKTLAPGWPGTGQLQPAGGRKDDGDRQAHLWAACRRRLSLRNIWRRLFGASLGLLLMAAAQSEGLPEPRVIGPSWVYSTEGLYHNVRMDLVLAIEGQGLVISYNADLASMLRRTANATGAERQVYDNAESLLFCSAELTYELTLNNPHNMTLCPYSIAIYTLTAEPGTVHLAIPAPALDQPDYAAIHQLLEHIIAATLEW